MPLLSVVEAMAVAQQLQRPGLCLRHWRGWLAPAAAAHLLARLQAEVPWKQEAITLYGRRHPLPRLTCWMADPGCGYRYSGLANVLESWSPAAEQLRQELEAVSGWRFNSLLLNRYRDGRDAMGWHADDEPELDSSAPIASLSLGARRDFRLRPRPSPRRPPGAPPPAGYSTSCAPFNLELHNGDLLLMDPPTQLWWQHAVPRRLRLQQERLNLTFRVVRSG
ncbi:MAG: alpha-ketoglutarate-dependent dioxygenase AlkB [Prochlorococcaceae cyanobacterium]